MSVVEVPSNFLSDGNSSNSLWFLQVIEVSVQIVTNHMGYFEFRICNMDYSIDGESQECFDHHLLKLQSFYGPNYSQYRHVLTHQVSQIHLFTFI